MALDKSFWANFPEKLAGKRLSSLTRLL